MKHIKVITSCLVFQIGISQTTTSIENPNTEKGLLKVTVLKSLSLSYEFRLNKDNYLIAGTEARSFLIETGTRIAYLEPFRDEKVPSIWIPYGILEYREYYNFERRIKEGKSISGNSGTYFGAQLDFKSNDVQVNGDSSLFISGLWGIQKTFEKGLIVNATGGFGPYVTFGSSLGGDASVGVFPTAFVSASLGLVLKKKR